MKRLTIGILAHVDAGKTTLCESLLYNTGKIRKLGRVDHRDAYLDTHPIERERGITIFSKQAVFETDLISVTLLDTPGHVDFSTEAERTLGVLDYAILVISGTDGIQTHTDTLWRLLRRYNVPTFIFINKMDLNGSDRTTLIGALRARFGDGCIDLSESNPNIYDELALCSEELFDAYSEGRKPSDAFIASAVRHEALFPCYFGSALKLIGINELIDGLERFTVQVIQSAYTNDGNEPPFGARVFKINRDSQGTRLTHIKLTSGSLRVRTPLSYVGKKTGAEITEKISQMRIYSGAKFEQVDEVQCGMVCAVTGLGSTYPGQGLGCEKDAPSAIMEPVLSYRICLPDGVDHRTMLPKLRQLEDEDPQLNIVWNERLGEIHVQIMGDIQIEILKRVISDRFDVAVNIDDGRIMYRETISEPIEGIGHFEPLRHYAEVHILLEPLPAGSGIRITSSCDQSVLNYTWQRLVLAHLYEKTHLGVLTGSPITDIKLTLIAGRASLNHTEGGDFRQATYRAVRQGLMKAKSVLLEPYYEFTIEIPIEQLGRAISDIKHMGGSFSPPSDDGQMSCFSGEAPVSAMRRYAAELSMYTRGRGRISFGKSSYRPCKDAQPIIEKYAYEPERDLDNTPDSVFCAHGAGFNVRWDRVESYMHVDSGIRSFTNVQPSDITPRVVTRNLDIDIKSLEQIMLREFGPIKRREYGTPDRRSAEAETQVNIPPKKKDYLIVDGYNMIFAWEGLNELAMTDLAVARARLMDIISNYRAYKQNEVLIVFDGYRVKGSVGCNFDHHNTHIVYTKENETADMYIEKLISEIGKNYSVRVATSDGLIQLQSVRTGVLRMTAKELESEVDGVNESLHQIMLSLKRDAAHTKIVIPDDVPLDTDEH